MSFKVKSIACLHERVGVPFNARCLAAEAWLSHGGQLHVSVCTERRSWEKERKLRKAVRRQMHALSI